jgi:hypothetical protein
MTTKHKRIVGDTLLPLNALITLNGDPVDLSAYTVKFQMETDAGVSVLSETNTGTTVHPTQAFTADATTNLLTCNGHGVKQDDQIIVASSGTLPTGLAASTRYFAVQVGANAFSLATTAGGAAIDITGAGTGTLTFYIVGSVQYVFLAASVATAGEYRGWFTTVSGSSEASYPDDEYGIPIEIVSRGN